MRPYHPDDLGDLYRICLLTADSGGDGTALYRDPWLPGDVYAAPYGIFEPSLATVAEDAEGVGGYILATTDSLAFYQRLDLDWWPSLRQRYPQASADGSAELSSQEHSALQWIRHGLAIESGLAARYPAHLHIDLLPRLQGRGIGRRLIETLTTTLRARGSTGLHLNVSYRNERAIAFYQHLGFTEVPADGRRVFVMDLRVP